MAHPPKIVSAEKLLELFSESTFQQKLSRCREDKTNQSQDPWIDSQRKKELIRYIDPETNAEICVVAVYTDNPPGTSVQRIILRLRTESDTYELRLI